MNPSPFDWNTGQPRLTAQDIAPTDLDGNTHSDIRND